MADDLNVDDALIATLVENRQKLQKVEDANIVKVDALTTPYKRELAKLFAERQPELDKVEGLWAAALSAQDSPLEPFIKNTNIDSKVLRAVTSVRVTISDDDPIRAKLTVTFRPNILTESTEVSREMGHDRVTTAVQPIAWKVPARTVSDSVFTTLFSEGGDEALVNELFGAFEQVYNNPLVFAMGDEEEADA